MLVVEVEVVGHHLVQMLLVLVDLAEVVLVVLAVQEQVELQTLAAEVVVDLEQVLESLVVLQQVRHHSLVLPINIVYENT
jgi:hypothetical protein